MLHADCSVGCRALEVWGSMEALARERNLRKEVEQLYQDSMRSLQLLIELQNKRFLSSLIF